MNIFKRNPVHVMIFVINPKDKAVSEIKAILLRFLPNDAKITVHKSGSPQQIKIYHADRKIERDLKKINFQGITRIRMSFK